MKDQVKVSAVQFAPGWLQTERNGQHMAEWAEKEAASGAELVVFPELSNLGYITPLMIGQKASFDEKTSALEFLVKYKKAAETVPGPTTDLLSQVARKWSIYIVVGLARLHPTITGTLYNASVLIGPTGIVGIQHKYHIPNNERWLFFPGHGPSVFETGLGKIGLSICYDGHFFPEIVRALSLNGAEIICEITAVGTKPNWEVTAGRFHPFGMDHIAATRALENQNFFIHCNRTGTEGEATYFGRSAIASPHGQLLAHDTLGKETAIVATLTNDELLYARTRLSIYRDRRPDVYAPLVEPLAQSWPLGTATQAQRQATSPVKSEASSL
jgi:omega-amidase